MKKNTKKALFGSVVVLILCCAMLIGTTFAWFTDDATTGVNKIEAGTLKVKLVDVQGNDLKDQPLTFGNGTSTQILWEPGATFETQGFCVKSTGSLALKYEIAINGAKVSDNKLMEVIKFKIVDGENKEVDLANFEGHLNPEQPTSNVMKITATMDSNAGNAYQGLTCESVSITVYATQDTYEYDVTGNQYDAGAVTNKNVAYVTTPDELISAFANLKEGGIISLGADMDMTGKTLTPVSGKGFTLNGNGHTISNLSTSTGSERGALFVSQAGTPSYFFNDVNLEDCSVASTSNYAALFVGDADTSGNVTISNCHVTNCTVSGGKYAAAFIAYTAGYNNGPVYGNYTISNCSVTGGSITGSGGSTGAAIGHAGGNPASTNIITNLIVKDVAINGEDADHTGIVVGTAHVGVTNISSINTSGVTGNYNKTHNLYGRFVIEGGKGQLTIDGVAMDADRKS